MLIRVLMIARMQGVNGRTVRHVATAARMARNIWAEMARMAVLAGVVNRHDTCSVDVDDV